MSVAETILAGYVIVLSVLIFWGAWRVIKNPPSNGCGGF